jgi:hypothetical protein
VFDLSSSPTGEPGSQARPSARREPTIAVPASSAKPPAAAVDDKLRAALGELVACRRLIDAALSDNYPAEQNGRGAGI